MKEKVPIVEPDLLADDMMTKPKPSFAFLVTTTSRVPIDFEEIKFSVEKNDKHSTSKFRSKFYHLKEFLAI